MVGSIKNVFVLPWFLLVTVSCHTSWHHWELPQTPFAEIMSPIERMESPWMMICLPWWWYSPYRCHPPTWAFMQRQINCATWPPRHCCLFSASCLTFLVPGSMFHLPMGLGTDSGAVFSLGWWHHGHLSSVHSFHCFMLLPCGVKFAAVFEFHHLCTVGRLCITFSADSHSILFAFPLLWYHFCFPNAFELWYCWCNSVVLLPVVLQCVLCWCNNTILLLVSAIVLDLGVPLESLLLPFHPFQYSYLLSACVLLVGPYPGDP